MMSANATGGKLMPVGSSARATKQATVSDDGYDALAILMFVVPGPNGWDDCQRESAWAVVEFLSQTKSGTELFFSFTTLEK